jgi:chromosomal replication initiation ATPase DnaA
MTNLHTEGLWFIQPEHVLEGPGLSVFNPNATSIRTIQEQVCKEHGITLKEMKGLCRAKKYALPRRIAMYRCVQEHKWSCTQISKQFNRHYTMVMHSVRLIEKDPEYAEILSRKRVANLMRWRARKSSREVCKPRTNMVQ